MYVHRVSRRRQTSSRASLLRRVVWPAGLLAFLAVVMLSFYVGAVAQRNGRLAGMGKLLARPLDAAYNYGAAHFGSTPAPEHIFLDLKFKHYNKLLEKRERALALGLLVRDDDDFVPAQIRTGSETLSVKLRLKGDLLDHLRRDRWSFRIHVKKGEQFHGMRRFSLQHPRTRSFVWEWAVLEAMRREEILAPHYGFLEVTLNGTPLGLYAYEESFGKELLESQARRESVIVKFNEAWRWKELAYSEGRTKRFLLLNNAAINVFNEQVVGADPGLLKHYEAAVANIESFRRGEVAACDAFDCERVARFWAVADLMGASHALHWINLRYYYNPITTRLEPIAFDCLGGIRLAHLAGTARLDLDELRGRDDPNFGFMADPRFARLYVEALQRVSRPDYLQALQEDLSDGLQRNLRTLQREWPWEDFDWGVLESNQALIRAFLDPPVALVARFDPASLETDRLGLRMANLLAFPVEVLGARLGEHELPLEDILLQGKPARGTLEWEEVGLSLPVEARPGQAPLPELVVWHRLLGVEAIREARAELGSPEIALQGAPRPPPGSVAFAARHPFLEIDREHQRVGILPGRWQVSGDLVVPAGFTLAAGPGTRLEFEEGAVLLSYSPLELVGRVDDPVVLGPQGVSWGGLQVIEAGGRSLVEQVAIHGTTAVDRPGWTLTGGVTFYESPVTLVGASFTDAHGEDALNLVRSEFRMTDCLFRDAAFDALDVDFGQGSIESTRFVEPGNDALDVSGSAVVVEDLVVLGAGDKGISAGEASDVKVLSARIEQSNIGIAAKDRSSVSVVGAEITGCRIGVAVFQKKPEFGGAFASLEGSRLERNETDFLVEVGSNLEIDGEPVQADARGVSDALYDR